MNSSGFGEDFDVHVDLTPLIDTVFLLLIFFIMATTFTKPILEVALQESEGSVAQDQQKKTLTITIDKDGNILCEEQKLTLETFEAFIAARPKEEAIVFNADKKAHFGLFVQVVDIAKRHGKTDFAILTKGKPRDEK